MPEKEIRNKEIRGADCQAGNLFPDVVGHVGCRDSCLKPKFVADEDKVLSTRGSISAPSRSLGTVYAFLAYHAGTGSGISFC